MKIKNEWLHFLVILIVVTLGNSLCLAYDNQVSGFSSVMRMILFVENLLILSYLLIIGIVRKKIELGFVIGVMTLFIYDSDKAYSYIWLFDIIFVVIVLLKCLFLKTMKLPYGLYDFCSYQIFNNFLAFFSVSLFLTIVMFNQYGFLILLTLLIIGSELTYNFIYYLRLEKLKKQVMLAYELDNKYVVIYNKNSKYMSNQTKSYFLILFAFVELFKGNYQSSVLYFDQINDTKGSDISLRFELKLALLLLVNANMKQNIKEIKRFNDYVRQFKNKKRRSEFLYISEYLRHFYSYIDGKENLPPQNSKRYLELNIYEDYIAKVQKKEENEPLLKSNGLFLIWQNWQQRL